MRRKVFRSKDFARCQIFSYMTLLLWEGDVHLLPRSDCGWLMRLLAASKFRGIKNKSLFFKKTILKSLKMLTPNLLFSEKYYFNAND